MVYHLAIGILATGAGARILALLLLAGAIRRTIRVEHTLWSATLVGIAKVFGQALTRASAIPFTAFSIGSTGTWVAGCAHLNVAHNLRTTLHEGISGEALLAYALHGVADHTAFGIQATSARTGIHTLLVHAG